MEDYAFTQSLGINMIGNISWINGKWISNEDFSIPIKDRGLSLSDGIFETILIINNKPQLLSEHLYRFQKSANILGMASPPEKSLLSTLINEGIQKSKLESGSGVIRINWSRGNNFSRGIGIDQKNSPKNHRFWLEINTGKPSFDSISTIISRVEKRNASSLISQCKTFAYGQAIQARLEAQKEGYDDAILLSTNGDICCGTTSNLIIRRNDTWITPPKTSGCLPGIMRQQGINLKLFKEERITPNPLEGDQWLLINSLGCKPIKKVNNINLNPWENPESLWRSLLIT